MQNIWEWTHKKIKSITELQLKVYKLIYLKVGRLYRIIMGL